MYIPHYAALYSPSELLLLYMNAVEPLEPPSFLLKIPRIFINSIQNSPHPYRNRVSPLETGVPHKGRWGVGGREVVVAGVNVHHVSASPNPPPFGLETPSCLYKAPLLSRNRGFPRMVLGGGGSGGWSRETPFSLKKKHFPLEPPCSLCKPPGLFRNRSSPQEALGSEGWGGCCRRG